MRPFEGVKILDCTHVLAGPFAAYQLAVLGADVIKVEDPNEPDQSRESGADMALNKTRMGTGFLTQGSNKRSIALNLKTEGGREALKRLVSDWADVLVENYRPGAFKALGLGYEELSKHQTETRLCVDDRLRPGRPARQADRVRHGDPGDPGIYRVRPARRSSGPIKTGAPVIDYATGTTGAFAIASALYQTLRTGKGQYIDMAMMDVALMMQASHITDHLHSGHNPKRSGNKMRFAETSMFESKGRLDPARRIQPAPAPPLLHRDRRSRPKPSAPASTSVTGATTKRFATVAREDERENRRRMGELSRRPAIFRAMRVRELRETLADPQLEAPRPAAPA